MKHLWWSVALCALALTACTSQSGKTPSAATSVEESVSEAPSAESAESALDAGVANSVEAEETHADTSEAEADAEGETEDISALTEAEQAYVTVEEQFTDITLDEVVQTMEQNETALVYAGRLTCPYCVKFMPILGEIVAARDLTVYSLDTEGNEAFEAFASEHGIEYVPALLYIQDGALTNLPLESPYPRDEVEQALDDVGL